MTQHSKSIIIGIDPGLRGALAFLDVKTGAVVLVEKMPVKDGQLDLEELIFFLSYHSHVQRVYIEQITPRPGQAVQAVKTSATNYGILIGACSALDLSARFVRPNEWAPHMHKEPGVQIPEGSDAKQKSLAVCRHLFPKTSLNTRKNAAAHDGLVDALLIAEYGRRNEIFSLPDALSAGVRTAPEDGTEAS